MFRPDPVGNAERQSLSRRERYDMSAPDPARTSTAADPLRVTRNREAVGSYTEYAEAQAAVDHLSDTGFPVEHLSIVGEELRTVERVTGRMTTARAALAGAGSGAVFGAFLGFLLGLFSAAPLVSGLAVALYGLVIGAVLGAVFGAAGHAALGGRRDFSSVQGITAGRYDVVCDADFASRASEQLRDRR